MLKSYLCSLKNILDISLKILENMNTPRTISYQHRNKLTPARPDSNRWYCRFRIKSCNSTRYRTFKILVFHFFSFFYVLSEKILKIKNTNVYISINRYCQII